MSECDRREHLENAYKCCGTCKYHQHESISQGWVCINDASDALGDWTDYDDYCSEWAERE